MTSIIFAPASGDQCAEFQREAKAFAKHLGDAEVHLFPVDPQMSKRRAFVLEVLGRPRLEKLRRVAFLCHGYRSGIQAGFTMDTVAELALALRWDGPSCIVSLYCCSTGRSSRDDGAGPHIEGEGSFADAFRDALVFRGYEGTWMLTHRTLGHLSRNPDVRMYRVAPNILGGVEVCLRTPLSPKATKEEKTAALDLYRRFRSLLHSSTGRWDISAMSPTEIEAAARLCEPYRG